MMHMTIDGGFGTRPHVVISVSNLERAFEFYTRAFGLKAFYRDAKGKYVELTWDLHHPRNIALLEISPEQTVIPNGVCGMYIAWESHDLDNDYTQLISRGIPVSEIKSDAGARYFWITDPDGNQHAVFQLMLG